MVTTDFTQELIHKITLIQKNNQALYDAYKELKTEYQEAVEVLSELLSEFNTITSMYEGGSIDRVRKLAVKVIEKAENKNANRKL